MLILDSRFWGKHISGGGGGKFDAFLNVFFCILGVFLGEFGILGGGGKSPQEIAGNNTDLIQLVIFKYCFTIYI